MKVSGMLARSTGEQTYAFDVGDPSINVTFTEFARAEVGRYDEEIVNITIDNDVFSAEELDELIVFLTCVHRALTPGSETVTLLVD